ncbi:hypothetical protein C8F04DRAFT_1110453 [Mycena alexandri]|uniref:Uncharacterized protein n=1 Tax=Mycena alexandri TaxID=1745969 RepID=A0AAD6SP31_9AGAR|nr:hypothetical protein C8F04DRAFT_1110453 [Mycena alexandri]
MTSDADRLRIAIALTALKFKPANQTCASYVLHLRSIFPPSTPLAPATDGSWRTHALALEEDLAKLKKKYEAEQIKTLVGVAAPVSDGAPSGSQSVKRKTKKKPNDKRTDAVDLEAILEDINGRPEFACVPMSDSLFSSFSAFQQLTSTLWSSDDAVTAAQRSLLLSTTTRTLSAAASVLHPILNSTEIPVSSQASTLQTLAFLVNHLVTSSLPFLLRKRKRGTNHPATVSSLLNKLLDVMLNSTLNPLVESFFPLSRHYLTLLFPPTPSKTMLPVDLRPAVLQFFQSAFSPLVSASSAYETNLRATVALTVLRQLENLFPPRRPDNTRLPWTHDNRVNGLVRKDTFWYLCTVLHIVFTLSKDRLTSESALGAVSERQIVDAFTRIVNRCKGKTTGPCNDENPNSDSGAGAIQPATLDLDVIDQVGYEMLLGVMERYWRWTGEVQPNLVL